MEKQAKTKPYRWYLKRTLRIWSYHPLRRIWEDIQDLCRAGYRVFMGVTSIILVLGMYATFPVSFPIIAYGARKNDVIMEAKIKARMDQLHEAMKPNRKTTI